jgi:hypothetical protein
MSDSLKNKAELYAIAALTEAGSDFPALTGIDLRQIDSDTNAAQERILVTATVAEKELQGAQCYPVEIEIEFRTTSRDSDAIDAVFSAIEATFADGGYGLSFANTNFSELIFFPEEMTASQSRGEMTRFRSRKFPFRILEN